VAPARSRQQPPPPTEGCRRTIFFSFAAKSSGGVEFPIFEDEASDCRVEIPIL
jgi:hypothetical protein